MNVLLVNPKYPGSFWGYEHALKFISRKATQPPLGLLTVAAMLPESWDKRLADMNVRSLRDKDLRWADVVFISAMIVQKESVYEVAARCKAFGVKIVAGGPLFTAYPEDFNDIDHLVLNEAEITLAPFLDDLARGEAKRVYKSDQFADVVETPVPMWSLVNMKAYVTMNLQYSRGCPYDCEFCDISVLYGRKVRTKSAEQVVLELESLYSHGWRGDLFLVDDNFIGNRAKLKRDVLPAMIEWSNAHGNPFIIQTEASIDICDDPELMKMMVAAGFDGVFIGIETPHDESLVECAKIQNTGRDMLESVRQIKAAGLDVTAGFILGFDNDPAAIFEKLVGFIQESGIVSAMVGLLNAPRNTRLHKRMLQEGRMVGDISGDNTDFSMNFVPKMDRDVLIEGYASVIRGLYSLGPYYQRVLKSLKSSTGGPTRRFRLRPSHIGALLKSIIRLGVIGKERVHYWRLLLWALFCRPRMFPYAVTFAIYGFHYRKFFDKHLKALARSEAALARA